jgi:hypothetical protein
VVHYWALDVMQALARCLLETTQLEWKRASVDDQLVRLVQDESMTAWLRTSADGGWCGFDANGWPATTWILHAIYERSDLPEGLTHDEVDRIERAVYPEPPPSSPRAEEIRELLARATLVGSPLGRSGRPGKGWHRVH